MLHRWRGDEPAPGVRRFEALHHHRSSGCCADRADARRPRATYTDPYRRCSPTPRAIEKVPRRRRGGLPRPPPEESESVSPRRRADCALIYHLKLTGVHAGHLTRVSEPSHLMEVLMTSPGLRFEPLAPGSRCCETAPPSVAAPRTCGGWCALALGRRIRLRDAPGSAILPEAARNPQGPPAFLPRIRQQARSGVLVLSSVLARPMRRQLRWKRKETPFAPSGVAEGTGLLRGLRPSNRSGGRRGPANSAVATTCSGLQLARRGRCLRSPRRAASGLLARRPVRTVEPLGYPKPALDTARLSDMAGLDV